MGRDLFYQAIPLDCELMQRALHDARFANCLSFFRSCIVHTDDPYWQRRWESDSLFALFAREAQRTASEHPGVEDRYFDGGRGWYLPLYYTLSPEYRSGRVTTETGWEENTDLMWRAIYGGDIIHESVLAGQGVPLHYMKPDQVALVAQALAPITREDLRLHFDKPTMLAHNVVPLRQSTDFPAYFHQMAKIFDALKQFYARAALHGEGVLTILD